jgi:hypothetical protein
MRIGVEDQVNLRTRASEDTGQRKCEKWVRFLRRAEDTKGKIPYLDGLRTNRPED